MPRWRSDAPGAMRRARWAADVALVVGAVVTVALCALAWQHTYAQQPAADAKPAPSVPGAHVVSLWLGDGYPLGSGVTGSAQAESCLTAQAMGWVCHVDAEAGTGFVASGSAVSPGNRGLPARVRGDTSRAAPDVVVVDAGRSDQGLPVARVEKAAARTFRLIHRAWPDATVVAIAPYLLDSATPPLGSRFVAFERRQVGKYGGSLIDPVAEGWIGPQTAGMIAGGATYPDAAGHRYIARHLAADLRNLGMG